MTKTTMTRRISFLLQKLDYVSKLQVRTCSAVPKFKLLDDIEKSIEENKIRPRKHPGINVHKHSKLPEWIDQAITQIVEDADQNQVLQERTKFANYLFSRRLPAEEEGIKLNYYKIEKELLKNKFDGLSESECEEVRKKINYKVKRKLKQAVFNWKPIDYNGYRSSLYMVTRSAAEYSALDSIFKEIVKRDPEFDPQTLFDFGSGVGTVLWAATQYWQRINEYVGIDISSDMHDLAEKIYSHSPVKIKGIYQRRYLPISNLKFELVVSAYTLMDLPDAKCRLESLSKLWRKTSKYLVVVEQGTRAGFTLINEAREFVKYMAKHSDIKSECFTFAPCPHDSACPRYEKYNTPCNFLTQYKPLSLLGPSKPTNELYSYIIMKKGKRMEDDNWYRIVRPTIARSRHARCRLCTPGGKLEEVIFTAAKHGKTLYRCAKVTGWGDRLPIRSTTDSVENVDSYPEIEAVNDDINDLDDNKSSKDEDSLARKEKEEVLSSEAPFAVNKNNP